MLNQVFARMPVAAILDDTIYCAHGGIPHLETSIEAIRNMPLDIHGERDSELFWEIVWSDPINEEQFKATCALFQLDPEKQGGYVRNTKRGAAWYICRFLANKPLLSLNTFYFLLGSLLKKLSTNSLKRII